MLEKKPTSAPLPAASGTAAPLLPCRTKAELRADEEAVAAAHAAQRQRLDEEHAIRGALVQPLKDMRRKRLALSKNVEQVRLGMDGIMANRSEMDARFRDMLTTLDGSLKAEQEIYSMMSYFIDHYRIPVMAALFVKASQDYCTAKLKEVAALDEERAAYMKLHGLDEAAVELLLA